MCFDDVTSIYLVGTNSAIVGSLWSWESILWPAKWMIILSQQSIFLFNTEPGLLGFASLKKILQCHYFELSFSWLFNLFNSFIQYLSSISLITFPLLRYSSFCDLFQLASCCTYKFHKELICCLLNGRDLYT